jgi:hypothetical protein
MSERKVKGSHLIQARALIDGRLGTGSYERLAAGGNSLVAGTLLPGSWYEVAPFVSVLRAVTGELGMDLELLSSEIARRNALTDLTSIYRVFLRTAEPHQLLQLLPQMWRTYVSFADARVQQNDSGHFVGQCEGLPRELLPWAGGCFIGFLPAALELCGCRTSSARVLRTARQPDETYFLQVELIYQKN